MACLSSSSCNGAIPIAVSKIINLKYVNKEDRYNVSCYTLGICYEMTGNRTKAIENYNKARSNFIEERDGEAEKLFYRLSKERVQKPLRDIDSLSIIAMNLRETGSFDASIEAYNILLAAPYISKFANDDDKAFLFSNSGHFLLV